ncbi:hypothetical protein ACHAWO_008734 [Cyclotella atomus]|uniref:Potassium channel domain-containing protein n=1 Tax=Cyclotella atomus TaxID=382360 RepID=A0ABD3NK42_9STRA
MPEILVSNITASHSSEQYKGQRQLLSPADYDVLATLHTTFHRLLERHQVHMTAQMTSLQQTTVSAVLIMLVLLVVGTAIVMAMCDVTIAQALLFSVYTVTSAGYGNVPTPSTVGFLLFAVAYVYLGISALAINVAQVYQYLETEHKRQVYQQKKSALTQEGLVALQSLSTCSNPVTQDQIVDQRIRQGIAHALRTVSAQPVSVTRDRSFLRCFRRIPPAFLTPLFLTASVLIGTIAMVLIEGWTFVEALYFSTFSMTTVGYGDITPTSNAGTWFAVCWLPLNVPFLALYLGTVGHYFVRITRWKEQRVEQKMRRAANITEKPYVQLSPSGIMESHDAQAHHVPLNKELNVSFAVGTNIPTNAEVSLCSPSNDLRDTESLIMGEPSVALDAMPKTSSLLPGFSKKSSPHPSLHLASSSRRGGDWLNNFITVKQLMEQLSDDSHPWESHGESKQSIRLRFSAMERLALIVVLISSLPSYMEIKSNEFWITVDSFKEAVVKWMIPYAAREAFRIATFETVLFVGERELLKQKMDTFWNMDPLHFNRLFGAVVLAMEGSVKEWMTATEPLATESIAPSGEAFASMRANKRRLVKNQIENYFPVNQGNAVLIQL